MSKTFKELINTDLIPEMSDIGGGDSWSLVTKSSGDVLDDTAINSSNMSTNLTFKVPAAISGKSRKFILVVKVNAKKELIIKNNDGSAFNNYIFEQSDNDPLLAFNDAVVGFTYQFDFLEVQPNVFKVKGYSTREHGLTHKIEFDTAGGTPVDPIYVADGEYATKPEIIPTKSGYIFQYWATNSSGTVEYTFGTPVTSDMILYARYILPEVVTVTFDTDGGSTVDPMTVYKGQTVEVPDYPTKVNCTFSGWYTDTTFSEQWNFSNQVMNSMTLHAKWVEGSTDWTTILDNIDNLKVGDELIAPSAYGFAKIIFEVVDIGHVTVPGKSKTVTLQAKHCLTTANSEYYRRVFDDGNNQRWSSSTIKTWLNTESAPAVARDNFLGSFLLTSSGSQKTGSDLAQAQAFISAISKPTLRTYTSSTDYIDESDCKVWLPSVKQMGGGTPVYNWGVENECLTKYQGIEGIGSNTKRAKTTTFGGVFHYWLRSAYPTAIFTYAWYVFGDGDLGFDHLFSNLPAGISPLITIAK